MGFGRWSTAALWASSLKRLGKFRPSGRPGAIRWEDSDAPQRTERPPLSDRPRHADGPDVPAVLAARPAGRGIARLGPRRLYLQRKRRRLFSRLVDAFQRIPAGQGRPRQSLANGAIAVPTPCQICVRFSARRLGLDSCVLLSGLSVKYVIAIDLVEWGVSGKSFVAAIFPPLMLCSSVTSRVLARLRLPAKHGDTRARSQ